jgi:hypothetical protein
MMTASLAESCATVSCHEALKRDDEEILPHPIRKTCGATLLKASDQFTSGAVFLA